MKKRILSAMHFLGPLCLGISYISHSVFIGAFAVVYVFGLPALMKESVTGFTKHKKLILLFLLPGLIYLFGWIFTGFKEYGMHTLLSLFLCFIEWKFSASSKYWND